MYIEIGLIKFFHNILKNELNQFNILLTEIFFYIIKNAFILLCTFIYLFIIYLICILTGKISHQTQCSDLDEGVQITWGKSISCYGLYWVIIIYKVTLRAYREGKESLTRQPQCRQQ